MRRAAACALTIVTLILAAVCGGGERSSGPAAGPVRGGTVVIAAPQDLEGATIFTAQNRYTQELLRYALFLPLVYHDPQYELVPALARSWQLLGDTAVIFELRDDVRWHDGVRTTAFDVEFTFDRAKDPRSAYPRAGDLEFHTDVEVLDSLRVRFRFRPHGDPLAMLPLMPIMPRHLLDTIPPDAMGRAAFNRAPVGNGPFRFVEARANDRWVFEANDDFPEELGGRPYLDRVVWRIIPDNTAQVAELRTGNADLILNPRAETFDAMVTAPGIRGITRSDVQYAFIGWNGRRPPLGEARVRRALALAIDRQRILDLLRAGRGVLAVGPIAPGHWAHPDTLAPLPYDTVAAAALLAEAGFRDVDGNGVLERNGRPLGFELAYPAESPINRDMAELIRSDLARVGVRAVPTPVEQNTLVARMTSAAREFDAVLLGWNAGFRIALRDLFHSAARSGPTQIAGYANREVDNIIDRTARMIDRDEARPLYARLLRILRDEQPWTFLYYYDDLYLARARLQGADMDSRGAFVNLPRWWLSAAEVPDDD